MPKLLVANWKMNPASVAQAVRLAKKTDRAVSKNVEVVIAPPFHFLSLVGKALKKTRLGAQDIFVSWRELKNLGVSYVIVGHSERRALGEKDITINRKLKAALRAGFKAILCVGEPLSVRKKGLAVAKKFVRGQLQKDLKGIQNSKFPPDFARTKSGRAGKIQNSLTVAYEPIWAIGTGKADKPEDTVEMIKSIKNFLNSKFHILNSKTLYGGSITAKNAAKFLSKKEINGALIGGASLHAEEFKKIIKQSRS